jgi:glycogen synthase
MTVLNVPQRVLMTADPLGGVWTYALELALSLEGSGVEVMLATMGGPLTSEQRLEVASLRNTSLFESHFKLEWMEDPWLDVEAAGDWLLRLESELKPDLIHLNGYVHGSLPWNSPTLIVGHSCVMSWWRHVKGDDAPDSWATYRKEVTHGLRAADLVVAPSRAMLANLETFYGSLSKTLVIYNGRRTGIFRTAPKEEFVLSAGRLWDQAKNVSALARIASRLEWPVYLAGEERHPEGASAFFEKVELLGRLPQKTLASWFARAAIYALPARYEPFGLSVLEAALAGCALVLGDIASLREIWHDAAVFVPPEDENALGAALAELINRPNRRRELSAFARERALEFSARTMAEGYLKAYSRIIGSFQSLGGETEAVDCAS